MLLKKFPEAGRWSLTDKDHPCADPLLFEYPRSYNYLANRAASERYGDFEDLNRTMISSY